MAIFKSETATSYQRCSMAVYHTFLRRKHGKKIKTYVEYNQSQKTVEKVVEGYNSGKKFLFCGIAFHNSQIIQIGIFRSEKTIDSDFVLPNGKKFIDADSAMIGYFLLNGLVKGVFDAINEFDIVPPQEESRAKSEQKRELGAKTEVFIVHGRDIEQALLLQKHLRDDLDIQARMFEDFKKKAGSTTIIEQLQYIWENAGYALVIATPDDCGVLHKDFEKSLNTLLRGKEKVDDEEVSKLFEVLSTRARQNVVFEFGLFIGALGRNNVCCLLQESTQERPSDIDGILYTRFNKSVDEKFSEIDAKLKRWLGKNT